MMIHGGYYIKSRSIHKSEIATAPPHVREIWDLLIRNANHATTGTIKRGMLFTSIKDIQDELKWFVGYRKEVYSKSKCEMALNWLRTRDMITTTKTTRGISITICNYDSYQDPRNYETNSEHDFIAKGGTKGGTKPTTKRTQETIITDYNSDDYASYKEYETNNEKSTKHLRNEQSPDTINKNDKKKNENSIPADFEIFWEEYHTITSRNKTDQAAALKYWIKLDTEERTKATHKIGDYFKSLSDTKYCKKARTYLADKNFNDEFVKPASQPERKKYTGPGWTNEPQKIDYTKYKPYGYPENWKELPQYQHLLE